MTIFKPAFENTTEILADVNTHFDNRREEKLVIDHTWLIRAFKEKWCIRVIGDFAKKFTFLLNMKDNKNYYYKEPKKEWPENKAYMIF